MGVGRYSLVCKKRVLDNMQQRLDAELHRTDVLVKDSTRPSDGSRIALARAILLAKSVDLAAMMADVERKMNR